MELEFFGAAGEVTGSCHILRVGNEQILLDCGLIQGGRRSEARNAEPFPFDARAIDAVLLSHAHIDHSGRLPLLTRRGFRGPIHTQNATGDLVQVLLRDAAYLQASITRRANRRRERRGETPLEVLYEAEHAKAVFEQVVGHRYNTWAQVTPSVRVRFHDAGHIMGSAVVEVAVSEGGAEKTLIFSGDLGQFDTPILRDPTLLEQADIVLMESTYGNRNHRPRSDTLVEMAALLESAVERRGNILIPAFAVGRSQELLYHLGKHYDEWGVDRFTIYLDSPMAIETTRVYWDYPHLYDDEATRLSAAHVAHAVVAEPAHDPHGYSVETHTRAQIRRHRAGRQRHVQRRPHPASLQESPASAGNPGAVHLLSGAGHARAPHHRG